MREEILKGFFEGNISAKTLKDDLKNTVVREGIVAHHVVDDMQEEFLVSGQHLVLLCDAVLSGELSSEDLEALAFCLIASDAFHWDTDNGDGELVAETVHDWASPEINYALTRENIEKFRDRLTTGVDSFNEVPEGDTFNSVG